MPIAQHSRELPSIGCLFPDMSEPGSGVEFLRTAQRVIFVEAVCSDFHRSVSRDRENSALCSSRDPRYLMSSAQRFSVFTRGNFSCMNTTMQGNTQ